MAITYISKSGGGPASGEASVPRPPGVATGDILLAHVSSGGGKLTATGWTVLQYSGWPTTGGVLWRYVSDIGTEPSAYTFNHGIYVSRYAVYAFRGVDSTNPTATAGDSYPASGSDASPTLASITTTVDGALLVYLNFKASGALSPPAGMASAGGLDLGRYADMFYESRATAGATGSRTATGGNSTNYNSFMTALRPAGDGPPPVTAKPWSYAQVIE